VTGCVLGGIGQMGGFLGLQRRRDEVSHQAPGTFFGKKKRKVYETRVLK